MKPLIPILVIGLAVFTGFLGFPLFWEGQHIGNSYADTEWGKVTAGAGLVAIACTLFSIGIWLGDRDSKK